MDNSQSASFQAGEAKGQVKEQSAGMMQRAQDAAHGASQSVQNAAQSATQSAQEAGGQMQQMRADSAKDASQRH